MNSKKILASTFALALLAGSLIAASGAETNKPTQNLTPLEMAKVIRLDSVNYQGVPLGEVISGLRQMTARGDPSHKGIVIVLAPEAQAKSGMPVTLKLQKTTLLEVLQRLAKLADLRLVEKDGQLVFMLKEAHSAEPPS